MADFRIIRDVWLHGRKFGRGGEDRLVEAGFTPEQRALQLSRGTIRMVNVTPPPVETYTAPVFESFSEPEPETATHFADEDPEPEIDSDDDE